MTTLDELIVAGVERGLGDPELLRLALEHRDRETVAETLARMSPPSHEQLEIRADGEESVS